MAPNWTYMIDNIFNGHPNGHPEAKQQPYEEDEVVDRSRPHKEGNSSFVGFLAVAAVLGLCVWQLLVVESTLTNSDMAAIAPAAEEPSGEAPLSTAALVAMVTATNVFGAAVVWYFFFRKTKKRVRTSRDLPPQNSFTPYGPDDIQRQMCFPPPYPNGWYKLCDLDELKNGNVVHVETCGLNLAVFRGDSGEVYCIDAFCPHLGANMAEGGKVKGDNIECPFHQWQFRGCDGKADKIPYSTGKIPDYARVKKYPCRLRYQMVVFYFDADECDEAPYELPLVKGVTDGHMIHRGVHEEIVNMHIYDFAENSADTAHFSCLHGRMMLPWTHIPTPFTIDHTAGWELDEDRKWMMYFSDKAHLVLGEKHLHFTEAFAKITFMGPGGMVNFRFTLPGLGEIVMFQTHTPVKPMVLRAEFSWWADPNIPRFLVWYVIGNWISQWAEDIRVWENKLLLKRPLLVRGDGPIMKLRRWYKQFLVPASYKQHEHFQHVSKKIVAPELGSGPKKEEGTSNEPGVPEPAGCTVPEW